MPPFTHAVPPDDLAHACQGVGESSWRQLAGQRLFFTGGTGILGRWLVATLQQADRQFGLECEIVLLSRDPDGFARAMPQLAHAPRTTLLRGDVRSFEFPSGRFDVVVHAATDVVAQNTPLETFSTCVDGTRRALALAARAGATDFLLLSSGAVYGRLPPGLDRVPESYAGAPDTLQPGSAYGEGKRASEWLACAQAAESGLRVRIARCFAFVGPLLPLDKQFAIGNFIGDGLAGRDIVVRGDGTACRSFLYLADMAAWVWAVLLRGRPGAAYNVGGAEAVSIAELAVRVRTVLAARGVVRVLQAARPGATPERYVPDVSLALEELGLPQPISLDEAIARTARWHRAPH